MAQTTETELLKQKLELERAKLLAVIQTLDAAEMLLPLVDGWSAQDILAHVANAEWLNVKFARLILEQDKPSQIESVIGDYPDYVGDYSLDSLNAYFAEKLRGDSLDVILKRLHDTRAATYEWLATLTPQQLERTGKHAFWGEQTLRGLCKILLLHDKMHAQDIARAVNAKQHAPKTGNALT